MKPFRHFTLAAILAIGAGASHAAPVLTDNFESGLSSSKWTDNGSGVIAADPLNSSNHVLKFTTTRGGGDIWSLVVGSAGTYTLSFDLLGTCTSGNCGAFIGINDSAGEHWLLGDNTYGTPHQTQTTGAWQHISFTFDATSSFRVKMEDYNGVAGDIYFDNICVAGNGADCVAQTSSNVPEPASLALAGLALAAMSLVRRQRRG